MDADNLGCVFKKAFSDSEEVMVIILKNVAIVLPAERPGVVTPPGLDNKRQQYLHKCIREYCTPLTMDITCPKRRNHAEVEDDDENIEPATVQQRKQTQFQKC